VLRTLEGLGTLETKDENVKEAVFLQQNPLNYSINTFGVIVTFPGRLAPNYFLIGRVLQRIAVEACNKYGWGIPFTQVTIHSADPVSPG
jgi:hypothetical protein